MNSREWWTENCGKASRALSDEHGGDSANWRRAKRKAKAAYPELPWPGEDDHKRLIKFMSRGRTAAEIEQAGFALPKKVEGYDLFETRNQHYELTYLLLPEVAQTIEVKPRIWTHRWAVDTDGSPQPYLMIQMPKRNWEKIKVVPIADVHYGATASLAEKFREYVNWIAENENVFCFINGDLFENSHGDSNKGVSHYEQNVRPRDQLCEMEQILAPIAHKILWMHPGNHEDRSRVRDYDPMERLCDRLDIPYCYEPVYADILWLGNVFSFHAKHGNTSSQTKGGKLNAAMRPQKFQDFTMFTVMSHVHDSISTRNTRVCRDRVNFRLEFRKQYVIITPSFFGYFGSYGSKYGYEPGSYGSINADLFRNGDYHANS